MRKLSPLYKEPYRNQFHYSAPIGWMNDINGFWFSEGLYHITYQHSQGAVNCSFEAVSIGHACSEDLIHFVTCPDIIMPRNQSVGAAWSGSVIIDTKNTLGYGENTVVQAYTDTKRGQCLAVSTDGGFEFKDISENPVLSLEENFLSGEKPCEISNQRDPKIFWLESENCYIMAVSFVPHNIVEEARIELYSSKNLINWDKLQTITKLSVAESLEKSGKDAAAVKSSWGFLFECPNLYPLSCEGEEYYILHGGDSIYAIGKFSGLHFDIIEAPMEPISYGPDFYAGQVFCDEKGKTLAVFWMDVWNESTVDTYPFKNSATFPIELSLKKTEKGLRIYKNPIEGISVLYEKSFEFKEMGKSIALDNLKAPQFDATVLIDLKETSSKSFKLKISKQEFLIDLTREIFEARFSKFGDGERKQEVPLFNKDTLKMRILADRDSVEIFFNDGRQCYTEEIGFAEKEIELSLYSLDGGELSVSGELHSVKSIWD